MKDITKSLLTHGAAVVGGYWFGRKGATPAERSKNIFSRFIPTLIIAYGITHFAINTPSAFFDYQKQSNNNETKLKEKALEKGINIYDNKTKEFDDLQKQFESYKNDIEKEKQTLFDISKEQNNKLNNIESKLNNINYKDNVSKDQQNTKIGSSAISSKEIKPYDWWVTFDKSDQKFYAFFRNKLVRSGRMIYAKTGGPEDKVYTLNEIIPKDNYLGPAFFRLEDVIGIAGPGKYNEYLNDIYNSFNSNKTGLKVDEKDAKFFMDNLPVGTKIEVTQ